MIVVTVVQLAAALAAAVAQTPEASATGQLQTLDLDRHPSARCLDGSAGGFYVRRAQTASRGATTGGGCIARFHVNRATFIVRFRDQASRGEGFNVGGHSNDHGVDAVRGVAVC